MRGRLREDPRDLVADLLGVGVEAEQDAGGDSLVLPGDAEEDVLGAEAVVAERLRLPERELEHLLRARRERDLAGRCLVAQADEPHDLGSHVVETDAERVEGVPGNAFLLAEQAKQQVLGADVVVLQRARLVLGENDGFPSELGEALEHG